MEPTITAVPTYPLPVDINGLQIYHHPSTFPLELGGELPQLSIAYHTYGTLNAAGDNVIWVCHALTANSDVADWWAGLMGAGRVFDPARYFIVCANILGSCYGTTGPRSIDPATGQSYGLDFPRITIRDMAKANDCLRQYLGIAAMELCIGGSCGGYQVLEQALLDRLPIRRMALLVCNARETAWAIAIHEAGRQAMEADPDFYKNTDKAGRKGLRAARAVGLLGYRTLQAYIDTQSDDDDRTDDFRAASYIRYQGIKLERRFYAHCYWHLLKALDTHHIGRGRGAVAEVLAGLDIPTMVISMDSDMLIPPAQQQFLAKYLPRAEYRLIPSRFGHDGFLTETDAINSCVMDWMGRS